MHKPKSIRQFAYPLMTFVIGLALGFLLQSSPEPAITLPTISPILEKEGFTIIYDGRNRNPHVVIEVLRGDSFTGTALRAKSHFREDLDIATPIRASLADYKYSGYDRGHMVPAASCKQSKAAMDQSFLLTNICPQVPQLNRGFWAKFERHIRELAKQYKKVTVFTGPLYLPERSEDGKKYVRFQVIGPNDVAVPTHFFKLLHLESDSEVTTEGYIVANEEVPCDTPLDHFKASCETIERASGIVFSSY